MESLTSKCPLEYQRILLFNELSVKRSIKETKRVEDVDNLRKYVYITTKPFRRFPDRHLLYAVDDARNPISKQLMTILFDNYNDLYKKNNRVPFTPTTTVKTFSEVLEQFENFILIYEQTPFVQKFFPDHDTTDKESTYASYSNGIHFKSIFKNINKPECPCIVQTLDTYFQVLNYYYVPKQTKTVYWSGNKLPLVKISDHLGYFQLTTIKLYIFTDDFLLGDQFDNSDTMTRFQKIIDPLSQDTIDYVTNIMLLCDCEIKLFEFGILGTNKYYSLFVGQLPAKYNSIYRRFDFNTVKSINSIFL